MTRKEKEMIRKDQEKDKIQLVQVTDQKELEHIIFHKAELQIIELI